MQYILGIAPNSPTTFWSMDGCDEPFLHWAIHVCNDPTPPLVHSISYGGIENDPPTFRRFDEEVQKLGVRGATVVVSSGDDGVGNCMSYSRICCRHPLTCSLSRYSERPQSVRL